MIAGHTITILVDSCFSPEERVLYTPAAITRIETHWEVIEQNLIHSLHNMYNETWAEPDDGFPELTATEFLAKLKLNPHGSLIFCGGKTDCFTRQIYTSGKESSSSRIRCCKRFKAVT